MKINTDKDCNIVIFDDTSYTLEEYFNTVSLYIVLLNKSNGTSIIYSKLDPHEDNDGKPIVISPLTGGFITFCHIILPKSTPEEYDPLLYIEKYVRIENFITAQSILDLVAGNYLISGGNSPEDIVGGYFSNGKVLYFKDTLGVYKEVSIKEVANVNPEAFGFTKVSLNFFSVCYLRKCYVALCLKVFNDRAFDRCFNGKVDSELIYKRDLVWAALNVILYMIDSNQLAEAERLLERINSCNGLCSGINTGDLGCGCNK